MAMSNIKLDIDVERNKLISKSQPRLNTTQTGKKNIEFQLELTNRFETLQEVDDIDTTSETTTYMIQQTASRVAKTISKTHKSRR